MEFGRLDYAGIAGEKAGMLFSYFLFTTVLYLLFSSRLGASYTHMMGLTLLISLIGVVIGRLLG